MCPACIANLALTAAAGATTAGGLTALIATRIRLKRVTKRAARETRTKGTSS